MTDPWTIQLDADRGVIRVAIHGRFTGRDFAALSDAVRAVPGNRDGLVHLYDYTAADVATVQPDDLRPVSERRPLHAVGHYLIVAPQDRAFGLSRVFEAVGRGRDGLVTVVRTVAEAEAWLDEQRRGPGDGPGDGDRPGVAQSSA